MYRKLIEKLKLWKDKKNRMPLILQGARQTGKTWLLKEFGRTCFKDVAYLNLENFPGAAGLFSGTIEPERIIEFISASHGKKIKPDETLIILDEIQEIPRALTSLKYFCENAPEYAVCCAGSLLGIGLHKGTSFPVGKVDMMKLEPMTFEEFLLANNESGIIEFIRKQGFNKAGEAFFEKLDDYLKKYIIIGGMPAAVKAWAEEHDFSAVQEKQEAILANYALDFSKHAPGNIVPRIRHLWDSLPVQLSKEHKKFVYGHVREGARSRDYEEALLWLSDARLIRKISRVSKGALPLAVYVDMKAFKLFHLDIGLLRVMCKADIGSIMLGGNVFEEFKGALAEQYAAQELASTSFSEGVYYWSSGAEAELDFVITDGLKIYPVEVKAGINLQAKSLKQFMAKYDTAGAVRFSMAGLKLDGKTLNIPLFLSFNLERYIADSGL
ncbi:MAG TPA: ATP-binding protein [Candidatus Goldiibacteriota bacterium]|nr:ATP-binding protein [Candidatus Goldiibacteriota bacterium]